MTKQYIDRNPVKRPTRPKRTESLVARHARQRTMLSFLDKPLTTAENKVIDAILKEARS
jgi:hypothetical protein